MSNVSYATGSYQFNFLGSAFEGNQALQHYFIRRLDSMICESMLNGGFSEYCTNLELEQLGDQKNIIKLDFFGRGRGRYDKNILWFYQERELKTVLSEVEGLIVTVEYEDILPAELKKITAKYVLCSKPAPVNLMIVKADYKERKANKKEVAEFESEAV